MPLKAITSSGEKVYAWKFDNKFQAHDWYREKGLFCPECKGEMFPRGGHGTAVRLHFAHKSVKCSSQLEHHYEGDDHIAAKEWVFNELDKVIKDLPNSQDLEVDIEIPLPQCGKKGRKADVGIFYKGVLYCVIECQISEINQEQLTQRIHDYTQQGIESYWLLGKKARTEENIRAITKYTEVVAFLETKQQSMGGEDFFSTLVT